MVCKYLCSNSTTISNFQPLEVVGRGSETKHQVAENLNKLSRGSETKLQVAENLNKLILQDKG